MNQTIRQSKSIYQMSFMILISLLLFSCDLNSARRRNQPLFNDLFHTAGNNTLITVLLNLDSRIWKNREREISFHNPRYGVSSITFFWLQGSSNNACLLLASLKLTNSINSIKVTNANAAINATRNLSMGYNSWVLVCWLELQGT